MLMPVGMLLAFAFMNIANIMEGGNPAHLFGIPALILVLGGTIMTVATTHTPGEVLKMPTLVIKGFKNPPNLSKTIEQINELADVARKDGALALEAKMNEVEDPFLKQAITLLVDGADEHRIRDELDGAINAMSERHSRNISMFQRAEALAPGFGLMGTTMGLIHMLGLLDHPEEIGHLLAAAMIATLYGLVTANVLWAPVAAKLSRLHENEVFEKDLMVEGVCAMLHGYSSRAMTEKLEAWLPPSQRGQKAA
ncbi:MAG: MotA/TolQ/ExbB proton channel family protein [Ilumatobacteraceae bacterium]